MPSSTLRKRSPALHRHRYHASSECPVGWFRIPRPSPRAGIPAIRTGCSLYANSATTSGFWDTVASTPDGIGSGKHVRPRRSRKSGPTPKATTSAISSPLDRMHRAKAWGGNSSRLSPSRLMRREFRAIWSPPSWFPTSRYTAKWGSSWSGRLTVRIKALRARYVQADID
jgi:hypothetical protein